MPRRPVEAVMNRDVITIAPESTARDAERTLAQHRISGAPVVDEAGHLLGVVSHSDLVSADAARPTVAAVGAFFTDEDELRDVGSLPADPGQLLRVRDVMTPEVLSVSPDTPLHAAARIMREHRVHRLLVVEGKRLCGIVSALDLLLALEEMGRSLE